MWAQDEDGVKDYLRTHKVYGYDTIEHPDIYAVWRDWMGTLAAGLEQRGIEVLNCSPDSALTCWPKVGLDEALRLHAQ